jgi:hypothetical protein
MKYLKIQNDGLLDIRLVALMGGTTKSKDKYKIGQFGTGLKYTLAYLFRNNLDFKIFVGEEEVIVKIETEEIRDERFEIICINSHRTSITTKMGEDWEAWMIVRELWCNALDEEAPCKEITSNAIGADGKTIFYIQIDNAIQKVLDNWPKYFIHGQEPIFSNDEFALYPPGDHLCLYKNGVLIKEHPNEKSVFSYDYKSADINELREYRGSTNLPIAWGLADANEKAARYFLENITENHYEGSAAMDYNWYKSFSQTWMKVIGSGKLIYPKVLNDLKARGNYPDETGLIIVPEVLYKALNKQFEGIGAVYVAGIIGNFYENYDERLEDRIKQGLVILETCDYRMHPELEFVYGHFEDKSIQARISLKTKKIYISQTLLQKPLFDIVSMLIEENEHFNTGMGDNTREFQQHFIDLYTKELLAKNSVEI